MALDLSGLVKATAAPNAPAAAGTQVSLDSLATGLLSNIFNSASKGIDNLIDNKTRSQNTQPVPDLSAAAAAPNATSYLNASAFGVSLPILALGLGALALVLYKR